MTCPNCEANVADGEKFCPNCGADILLATTPEKPKSENKDKKPKIIKILTIVIPVVLIGIIIVLIASLFVTNKGELVSENISKNLGRSVAMAEKNTQLKLKTSSSYTVLKDIVNYNYIYESKKSTKIEGINVPEWVVFITVDNNDKIDKVTYYNFKVLQKNWKGQKIEKKFDESKIKYKTTLKDAKKLIPLKPLAITSSNSDETIYLYKYYYTDSIDKNEKAYYLTVKYDMNNSVKDIDSKMSDYISFIFK